jgi:hypothetical protein
MGYELDMYVVDKSYASNTKIVLVDNNVYSVYSDYKYNDERLYFYPDGNTRIYIKKEPIIKGSISILIGMLDLCKTSLQHTGICKFEESDGACAYDPSDGNKLIGLDPYGDFRSFVPIATVIEDLLTDLIKNKGREYRRHVVAFEMLKAIQNTFKGSDIGCLFYGH